MEILHEYNSVLESFPPPRSAMDYRFKQDAVCLLAKKKNDPVGFLWLVQHRYKEDIVFCDFYLGPDLAWDFDVVILEPFRVTSAFSILWDYAFNYLRTKNVKWIYSRISTMNRRSIEVHEKLGGWIFGNILFIRIGSLHLCLDMIQNRISIHSHLHRKIIKLQSL